MKKIIYRNWPKKIKKQFDHRPLTENERLKIIKEIMEGFNCGLVGREGDQVSFNLIVNRITKK